MTENLECTIDKLEKSLEEYFKDNLIPTLDYNLGYILFLVQHWYNFFAKRCSNMNKAAIA